MSFEAVLIDLSCDTVSFGLLAERASDEERPRFGHCREARRDRYAGLVEAIADYRGQVPADLWPDHLVVSVMGPVTGNEIRLMHTDWTFRREELKDAFDFAEVFVANDIAALTQSLPLLGDGDIEPLAMPQGTVFSPETEGRMAVLSLGERGVGGAVIDRRDGESRVLDCEVGHSTFAPVSEIEDRLRDAIGRQQGRVTWEAVLGQGGLPGLYGVHAEAMGEAPQNLTALEVVLYGRTGTDVACRRALGDFWKLMGRFAGDVALQTGAFGGVCLSGRMGASLRSLVEKSGFRAAFEDKAPCEHLLRRTPTYAVVNSSAPMIGLARFRTETLEARARAARGRLDVADLLQDVQTCANVGTLVLAKDGACALASPGLFADAPLDRDVLARGTPFAAAMGALVAAGQINEADAREAVERCERHLPFELTRRAFGGRRFRLKGASRPGGGTVIVERDVTDEITQGDEMRALAGTLRAAKAKADAASRAKSEFLANMSHEIRTPMNGVLGMADILGRTQLSADQAQMVDVIQSSAQGLLTVINDILDFSKVEAGKMRLDPRPFDLRTLTEDVAAAFGAQTEKRGIELVVRYAPGTPQALIGDAGRLRQAMTNIVGNAVKFTEEGHVLLDVQGEARDGFAELTVTIEDTGCGIPASQQAAVFEVFGQADGTATRTHEGTGLGLNITKAIVELMGGGISLRSQEGRGTSVALTLSLPLGEEADCPAPADDVVLAGARVLVVDDKAVNRRIIEEQVRVWGMVPVSCEGAAPALELLHGRGEHFDAAILDFQMPGLDGVGLARRLRGHERTADLPLVLLTSVGHAAEADGYADARFDAALIKPARATQLRDALASAVAGHTMPPRVSEVRAPQAVEAPAEEAAEPSAATPTPEVASIPQASEPAPAPVAEAEPMPSPAPASPPVPSHNPADEDETSGRLSVLVAEDNPVNRMVIGAMLASDLYEVRMAEDGEAAVEAYRAERPDVVLMDISMPRLDGLEATRRIRGLEGGGHRTPIIGVTAHAVGDVRGLCLDAGMDDYVAKPVQQSDILGAIAKAKRNALY